jgi:hypothetical protein
VNDTVLLVDADSIAYRAAASAEGLSSSIAIARAHDSISRICNDLAGEFGEFQIILSREHNFRKFLTASYKANRVAVQRPEFLPDVVSFIRTEFPSNIEIGSGKQVDLEGDDIVSISHYRSIGEQRTTIIAGLDKDLRQIPTRHYNWVKGILDEVSEHEGRCNFYTQLVIGDRADNVGGYDGTARVSIPKFLQPVINEIKDAGSESEKLGIVCKLYQPAYFSLLMNGNLLHLLRHEEDYWCPEELKKILNLDYIQDQAQLHEYLSSQGMSHPNTLELIGEDQTNGFQ